MKKIFIFAAMLIAFCSCEKLELMFNKSCMIENAMPIETMVGSEVFANATSSSTEMVVYETIANIKDDKYFIRETTYSLEFGTTKRIVLDNRTKYVYVTLITNVKTANEKVQVGKTTNFIKVFHNMTIVLDNETLNN